MALKNGSTLANARRSQVGPLRLPQSHKLGRLRVEWKAFVYQINPPISDTLVNGTGQGGGHDTEEEQLVQEARGLKKAL